MLNICGGQRWCMSDVSQPLSASLLHGEYTAVSLTPNLCIQALLCTLEFGQTIQHIQVKICFAVFTPTGLTIHPRISLCMLPYAPAQLLVEIPRLTWNCVKKYFFYERVFIVHPFYMLFCQTFFCLTLFFIQHLIMELSLRKADHEFINCN